MKSTENAWLAEKLNEIERSKYNEYSTAKYNYLSYFENCTIDENTIFMGSQHGINFNGNIFYIAKYLSHNPKYEGFKKYLCVHGKNKPRILETLAFYGMDDIIPVILSSGQYYELLASAKYLITDNTVMFTWIKKPGQVLINTWHGTPLKTLGRSVKSNLGEIGNAQKSFCASDYILFPNEFTKEVMLRDYMLENLAPGSTVLAGYPRNAIFFDRGSEQDIRNKYGMQGKRCYAYMPTFRGSLDDGMSLKAEAFLIYYLYELDKVLGDDEEFFVNLHPVSKSNVDFSGFKKIKEFPKELETYEFLNACDVLITDYSSVFFDYAITKKKIVLFPFDREDYLRDRGTYMSIDDLPFPKVYDMWSLLEEIRKPKAYDDSAFLESFSKYEEAGITEKLCDQLILGENCGLECQQIADNKKDNILFYLGDLAKNGITASGFNLLKNVDKSKANYILMTFAGDANAHSDWLYDLPKDISFFVVSDHINFLLEEDIIYKTFLAGEIRTDKMMKRLAGRFELNFDRAFGGARINSVVHFNGYSRIVSAFFASFKGPKSIFVHNNMLNEIKHKDVKRDLLEYAYKVFDNVVLISEDQYKPTKSLMPKRKEPVVCHNLIDKEGVLARSQEELKFGNETIVYPNKALFMELIDSHKKKFISIGRFSEEKGHIRLLEAFSRIHSTNPETCLFIMGGVALGQWYEVTIEKIKALKLEDSVVLIKNQPNPYPILKKCDYFVMSSFYEGLPVVITEADILGLPVTSTDIPGPASFLRQYGGTYTDNSTEGIVEGMRMLLNDEVKMLNIDYEAYNKKALKEFEDIIF